MSHRHPFTVDPRRWRGAAALAFLALVTVAVACGGEDEDETAPSTTTRRTPDESSTTATGDPSTRSEPTTTVTELPATTAPGTTPEQEVVDRYVGYWRARFEANTGIPDPSSPELRAYATGAQLEVVVAEARSNLDEGLAFRPADDPHDFQRVTVVQLGGDRAVVQECVVSDGVVFRRATGEVVDDEIVTHNVRGELTRVDGVWKVSEARLIQRWEGVAGCALDS